MKKIVLLIFFYPLLGAEKQKAIMVYKSEIYHLDVPHIPYNYMDKYDLPDTFTAQVKYPKLMSIVESRIRNQQSFFAPILIPDCAWNNEDWDGFHSPVSQAIQKDLFAPITQKMLQHGLDPFAYTRPDHPYTIVLEDAASNGSIGNVKLLLNACNPQKLKIVASRVLRNFAGHHDIDAQKRYEVFQLLLNAGADPNYRCSLGKTALYKSFFDAGKPVAAICHGPWTLINAGVVRGLTVTSWPSIKQDLINAEAPWVDQEVVTDKNLVTSRKPADIHAFNKAMIELFAKAK